MRDVEISRLLDGIELDYGAHFSREDGMCAMEMVAYLAGEPHTYAPACASELLAGYTIRLNDSMSADDRGRLKPFLPRLIGSAGGDEPARFRAMAELALSVLIAPAAAQYGALPWLRALKQRSSLNIFAGVDSAASPADAVPADRKKIRQFRDVQRACDHAFAAADKISDGGKANWHWCGGELGLAVADACRLNGVSHWHPALQILDAGIEASVGNPPARTAGNKRLHLLRAY